MNCTTEFSDTEKTPPTVLPVQCTHCTQVNFKRQNCKIAAKSAHKIQGRFALEKFLKFINKP